MKIMTKFLYWTILACTTFDKNIKIYQVRFYMWTSNRFIDIKKNYRYLKKCEKLWNSCGLENFGTALCQNFLDSI